MGHDRRKCDEYPLVVHWGQAQSGVRASPDGQQSVGSVRRVGGEDAHGMYRVRLTKARVVSVAPKALWPLALWKWPLPQPQSLWTAKMLEVEPQAL